MMQTSVRMLSFRGDCDGVLAVAIQMDVLACESSLIEQKQIGPFVREGLYLVTSTEFRC